MAVENKDTFLNFRKQQEEEHLKRVSVENPLSSLLTVEINTTELCNRKCVFCPRFDKNVYPNRNLNMDLDTAYKISKALSDSNYLGKISFSGFSENFINKKFIEIVEIFRINLPINLLECNTNGDFLTTEYAGRLYRAGLDNLYINLYDGIDQIAKFDEIMKPFDKEKYKFRAHYSQEDYGLNINNRGGSISWLGFDESTVENLAGKPCYYPFYKMFVDWNGDVLFCSNDWQKEIIVGNLTKQSLESIWLSDEIRIIRERLIKGDRTESPCNKCTVNGQLFGKPSFHILKEYYESSNNRS
jgi:radical SAM protein with 4Fe4S-binding SPASM domain